jgi:hemerythrin superfamily protein
MDIGETQDAIELLKSDHKEVAAMFEEFNGGDLEGDAKDELADKICKALSVHAQIEEEIFYPAAREALDSDDEDLLDEAEVEHGSIKELVAAIQNHEDDGLFDAQVKVVSEWVKHHVKEEEGEMFPKLQKTDMDMDAIGAQLAERKDELMSEDSEEAAGGPEA